MKKLAVLLAGMSVVIGCASSAAAVTADGIDTTTGSSSSTSLGDHGIAHEEFGTMGVSIGVR
ncbi:hypothetical protein ACFYOI_14720 [Streptomyces microflavus]|uniref:hypothetical protein n=1 Tax=Streptomyces microflavus TaxID=1919 RepID=UPI0033B4B20A